MPFTQSNIPPPSDVNLIGRRSEKIWLPVWADREGNPIVNAAGQLPLKPIYHQFSVNVWTFKAIRAGYTDEKNANELDSLNSAPWRGYSEFQAWVSEIHSDGSYKYGTPPVDAEEVTYVIRCIDRYKGWKCQHPDVGWDYLDSDDLKRFLNADGKDYIGKLDTDGSSLGISDDMLIRLEDVNKEINFQTVLGF